MRICRVRREIRPCLIDEADAEILADEGEEQRDEAGERGNEAHVGFRGIAAAHGAVQSRRQRRRWLLTLGVIPGMKFLSREVYGAPPQRIKSLFAEKDRQTCAQPCIGSCRRRCEFFWARVITCLRAKQLSCQLLGKRWRRWGFCFAV